jgi:hypothetical protein
MPPIQIALINASKLASDAEVAAVAAALQTQVSRDFAPAWGIDASLRVVSTGQQPADGECWLSILDDADHADSLGYHDLTSQGLPLGKVFVKTAQQSHTHWSVVASHELLEMLADPNVNLTVFDEAKRGGKLYAYEVCDACEGDDYAYAIDGVLVSDFVFPAWFESFRTKASTRFDFGGHINAPLTVLKGGYISVYEIKENGRWQQLNGQQHPHGPAPKGSRRARRAVPVAERKLSAPT